MQILEEIRELSAKLLKIVQVTVSEIYSLSIVTNANFDLMESIKWTSSCVNASGSAGCKIGLFCELMWNFLNFRIIDEERMKFLINNIS